MAQKIKSLGDHVLVEPVDEKEIKKDGMIISAEPHPTSNLVSGLANSTWIAPWTLHGIPELDSPLAG